MLFLVSWIFAAVGGTGTDNKEEQRYGGGTVDDNPFLMELCCFNANVSEPCNMQVKTAAARTVILPAQLARANART